MRCEAIRELIMTDYTDGEMNPDPKRSVEEHLETCASCKAFKESVYDTAIRPFKGAGSLTPPERVWKAIEEEVGKEPRPSGVFSGIAEALKVSLELPRLRLAAAAIAMIVFAVAVIGYQRYARERSLDMYIAEQAAFMSQLSGSSPEDTDDFLNIGNFL